MRQQPEVLDGFRGPRTDRMDKMREATDKAETEPAQLPAVKKQGTTYVSQFRRYRVQVTAPMDRIDPATGLREIGRPIVAQFEDGVYVNDHKDPKIKKLIDDQLQGNPFFGKFGDGGAHYWLADTQQASLDRAKLEAAKATLSKLPKEVVEEFVASLKPGEEQDHKLPARP